MKRISYCRPYIPLGSPDDPVKPEYIMHGFVELRDDDNKVLSVLPPGSIVGIEVALGCERRYNYFTVGNTVLKAYDTEDAEAPFAIAQTLDHILQWAHFNHFPANKRIRAMFNDLFPGTDVNITVTDIARICNMTRVWANQILIDMQNVEQMGRRDQYFYLMPGGRRGKIANS